MKIARFWGWGRPAAAPTFWVRGWSDRDQASAEAHGRERAERLFSLFQSGTLPPRGNSYAYGDRVLPEPILLELRGRSSAPTAVVTRNAYGSRVLNTRDVMFVDIDVPEPSPAAAPGLFGRLFGRSSPQAVQPPPTSETCLSALRNAGIGRARIYRTRNGFRVLVLGRAFDPESTESDTVLRMMGADEKYRKLCKLQASYRARLTPKPWRCGGSVLDVAFPPRNDAEVARLESWQKEYERMSGGYRTCELLETVGGDAQSSEEREIVELHDRETRIDMSLPLA